MVSEAQKSARDRYDQKNFEQITIKIRKGKKDLMKKWAAAAGLSMTAFLQLAVEEKAERDGLMNSEEKKLGSSGR